MEPDKKLRFIMDDTSTPYEEHESPFIRTKEDDDFDEMLIKKYHLITTEMEDAEQLKLTPYEENPKQDIETI